MSSERVLIVGIGGLGVPAALAVARAGVHHLGLIDPDWVELSNLARQTIFGASDIDAPKVIAAKRRLIDRVARLDVETHQCELDSANAATLIGSHDFTIDATDNPAAKFLINDVCIATGRPFSYGGVLGFAGQTMTVIPGHTACLRCLFEAPPDADEIASCRDAGIVGPVAGAIGEVQAAEALAWIRTGKPRLGGAILTYDGAAGKTRVTPVAARADCPCGAWRAALQTEELR